MFPLLSEHDRLIYYFLFLQILSLRRKLNYLFKVLTGNVTGHYLLDLRNEQHRTVGQYLLLF